MDHVDITIIGAGVIGLAIAERLTDQRKTVLILEKNKSFGQETSSRNSEVIHAGIYYPQTSLKAQLCVRGKELLYDFLSTNHIAHQKTGKYIVASDISECACLETLHKQAYVNGVCDLELIDQKELHKRVPYIRGVSALFSPSTGIFDTHSFMKTLLDKACRDGADIIYETEFLHSEKRGSAYELKIKEPDGSVTNILSQIVINCAGLNADSVANNMGIDAYTIHYCKGEYFRIAPSKTECIPALIYPVPQRESLGVHLTPDLGGGVRIGPNATYIDKETVDYTVDMSHMDEFLSYAQKLLPVLKEEDIFPDTAGIRPKLQGPTDEFKDFVISHETDRGLPGTFSLIGIESPGLTASLAIADLIRTNVHEYMS